MPELQQISSNHATDLVRDEDGDPLVTSRPVDLTELVDHSRCIACQQQQRRVCHVKHADEACIQCVATSTAGDCRFVRKVYREFRIRDLAWPELIGHLVSPYKDPVHPPIIYHHPQPPHQFSSPQSHTYSTNPPRPDHFTNGGAVERPWTAHQNQPPLHPALPPPLPSLQQHQYQLALASVPGPTLKRQRTDLYDGKDVFAHSGRRIAPTNDLDAHLPDVKLVGRKHASQRSESIGQTTDEKLSPITVDLRTTLDLKPPMGNLKRKVEIDHAPETQLPHSCTKCDASFKTPAELKKHFARHEPQYFCHILGCSRGRDGFTTKNDLDRHRKTMHKIVGQNDRFWKCFYRACAKTDKVWPRLDNFKAHIIRMHGAQYVTENVAKAEEWWDHEKSMGSQLVNEVTQSQTPVEARPGSQDHLLSSHMSSQAEPMDDGGSQLVADARTATARVHDLSTCLRCRLLGEVCDDNKVCQKCGEREDKCPRSLLVCRRGPLSYFLIPLIPYTRGLPSPVSTTTSWNIRHDSTPLLARSDKSCSGLLTDTTTFVKHNLPHVERNSFTQALMLNIDAMLAQISGATGDYQTDLQFLYRMRDIIWLLRDLTVELLQTGSTVEKKANLAHNVPKVSLDLESWYDDIEEHVFTWTKSDHIDVDDQDRPWRKWTVFFSIALVFAVERFTTSLSTAWAIFKGQVMQLTSDSDEATDTLCALLDLRFSCQTVKQDRFLQVLRMDQEEWTKGEIPFHQYSDGDKADVQLDLRANMEFLHETDGFETWRAVYDRMGEGTKTRTPRRTDDPLINHKLADDESERAEAVLKSRDVRRPGAENTSEVDQSKQTRTRCCRCHREMEVSGRDDVLCDGCDHEMCEKCERSAVAIEQKQRIRVNETGDKDGGGGHEMVHRDGDDVNQQCAVGGNTAEASRDRVNDDNSSDGDKDGQASIKKNNDHDHDATVTATESTAKEQVLENTGIDTGQEYE